MKTTVTFGLLLALGIGVVTPLFASATDGTFVAASSRTDMVYDHARGLIYI